MAIRISRILLCLTLLTGIAAAQDRIKAGWNLFSPEQDVQLGKEAAAEIEKEVTVVNDKQLTDFVARIGKRLADASPAPDYPYTFKVVADPNINAFALPGGPIYIHTGLITSADNEAQVAGVVAHEVGHVALRHSTNQASKAQIFQIPLLLAGGMLDQKGGLLGSLSQIGIGFGLNSVFMKYSRSAEKDADILGARMMADVGYDPAEMATFFSEARGGRRRAGNSAVFLRSPQSRQPRQICQRRNRVLAEKGLHQRRSGSVQLHEGPRRTGQDPGKAQAGGRGRT